MAYPALPFDVRASVQPLPLNSGFGALMLEQFQRRREEIEANHKPVATRFGKVRKTRRTQRQTLALWQLTSSELNSCLSQWVLGDPIDLFKTPAGRRQEALCIEVAYANVGARCRFASQRFAGFDGVPDILDHAANRDVILVTENYQTAYCIDFTLAALTRGCHVLVLDRPVSAFLQEHPQWARLDADYARQLLLPHARETCVRTQDGIEFKVGDEPNEADLQFALDMTEKYREEQGHAGQNLFIPRVDHRRFFNDFFAGPDLSYRAIYELMRRCRTNMCERGGYRGVLPVDLMFDQEPTLVYESANGGKLFLGPQHQVCLNVLDQAQIKLIISVGATYANAALEKARPEIEILELDLADDGKSSCFTALAKVVAHIKFRLEKGEAVFIHCYRGISRSATVAIACLMAFENLSMERAFEKLHQLRNRIGPSRRLQMDLLLYERVLWPDGPRKTLTFVSNLR